RAPAPDNILLPDSEDWMSIYYTNQKIGYSHTLKQRSSKGYAITQDLLLRLMILGFPRQMHLSLTSTLTADFYLKEFNFKMVSGYLNYALQGTVEGSTLRLNSDLMGQPQTVSLTLKEPPQLPLTLPYQVYRAQMKPGDQATFSLFDPAVMTPSPVTITAGPTELLTLEEEVRPGQRFEMHYLGNKMTVWIDYQGRVLKEEGLLGFRLIHSTPEKARRMESSAGPDLATEMSIKVSNPPNPKLIKRLILRLSPLPERMPQTEGRQRVRDNRVTIEQEPFSSQDTYDLPYPKGDLMPYLADHPALTLKDPRLLKALKEALGQEKEAQKAAIRLNTWVFQIIKKQPTLSIPRAVEVLRQREGDCNEHATLLLALLRAAGIPSRMALGITLLRDRFYYHAWVEAYLGRRWISLDPTFNQIPADVTHLKLAEGMEEGLVSLLPVIGKLKIQIESAL
ncbi:MAG: hypothetical protein C0407_12000, partial [Desulfobacca sp.]|nr:hypothetical protein [Desulfobacca sp.]